MGNQEPKEEILKEIEEVIFRLEEIRNKLKENSMGDLSGLLDGLNKVGAIMICLSDSIRFEEIEIY
jgi:hypothetical protein